MINRHLRLDLVNKQFATDSRQNMKNLTDFRRSVFLVLGVITPLSAGAILPTNNDPSNQIRFDTPAEADAKRQQLTDYIWSNGLPTSALPTVSTIANPGIFSGALNGINSSFVSAISKIDTNVSGFDFFSTSYLLHPSNTAQENRFVIVHQGHYSDNPLSYGIGDTVNNLLQQGFSVDVMQMPLYGWNTDRTANVPGQGALYYSSHDDMIMNTGPHDGGMGFRLFLEPVIQNINYFEQLSHTPSDISMIGLSGGGWTTSMAAAIDPRISLSIPVAGSAPLYIRNTQASSLGDTEQYYKPLFAEDIAADGTGGGIATWEEIYALGGYGVGRQQIMVTNQFDNCCFSGAHFADPFKAIIADKVSQLGEGQWEYVLDTVAPDHQLSSNTLTNVIDPALIQTPIPPSLALLVSGLLSLGFFRRRNRQGTLGATD